MMQVGITTLRDKNLPNLDLFCKKRPFKIKKGRDHKAFGLFFKVKSAKEIFFYLYFDDIKTEKNSLYILIHPML